MSEWEQSSTTRVVPQARPRKLAKVPFVELAEGRLQGVVSSGSDIARVYVSSVRAGDHEYSCSTNNNRPCGGARGGICNHIRTLLSEAVVQYGAERVARYLRVDLDEADAIEQALHGKASASSMATAGPVFARFLRQLAYLELPASTTPLPEMQWFAPVEEVR
jgi:hypothetical protein